MIESRTSPVFLLSLPLPTTAAGVVVAVGDVAVAVTVDEPLVRLLLLFVFVLLLLFVVVSGDCDCSIPSSVLPLETSAGVAYAWVNVSKFLTCVLAPEFGDICGDVVGVELMAPVTAVVPTVAALLLIAAFTWVAYCIC